MKRIISVAIIAAAVASICWGCFKDTVAYTIYNVSVFEQTAQNGPENKAEDLFAYAYFVDTTEWRIASWEDAQVGRITNKTTGEIKEIPDRIGDFIADAPYQVSIELNKKYSMIVIVDRTLRMYAYRKYELPVNLPSIKAKLHLSAWKRSHTSSGWMIVNPFFGVKDNSSHIINQKTNE